MFVSIFSAALAAQPVPFDSANFARVFLGPQPRSALLLLASSQSQSLLSLQKHASSDQEGKYSYLFAVPQNPFFHNLALHYNYSKSDLLYLVTSDNKKYTCQSKQTPISQTAINEFVQSFQAGTAKRFIRYQKAVSLGQHVRYLDSQTFSQTVLNSDKQSVILFYNWFQRYNKRVLEKLQQFANKVKHISTLQVCAVDGVANQIEGVEYIGSPTIYWSYGKHNKTIVRLNAQVNQEQILKSISQHTYHPLKFNQLNQTKHHL